ncbi:hypothetical protein GUITHDRAFT_144904 [Guillardia theta CCMP2712]|uniref:Uncharacterized protein n=1 Tax=Guillardia theta (strain CCMP2712) TaxID=905079 RepID=L1IMY0_GUITC|nr:hypothetical protein GUITHDRAFT_144904 [Guillardia theta CCMP2712]EKX37636.1 hypothetical protein GUITHDRAFT_144904 [Guillardia theta CCMP2712]|eukprot:XP_005824616.1 hypothetical protein GUITHDRAFT_144904 [Guillardia theta CCMP2712]
MLPSLLLLLLLPLPLLFLPLPSLCSPSLSVQLLTPCQKSTTTTTTTTTSTTTSTSSTSSSTCLSLLDEILLHDLLGLSLLACSQAPCNELRRYTARGMQRPRENNRKCSIHSQRSQGTEDDLGKDRKDGASHTRIQGVSIINLQDTPRICLDCCLDCLPWNKFVSDPSNYIYIYFYYIYIYSSCIYFYYIYIYIYIYSSCIYFYYIYIYIYSSCIYFYYIYIYIYSSCIYISFPSLLHPLSSLLAIFHPALPSLPLKPP